MISDKNQAQETLDVLEKITEICELNEEQKKTFYANFRLGLVERILADFKEVTGEEAPVIIGQDLKPEEAERVVKSVWEKFSATEKGVLKLASYVDEFLTKILERIEPELTDEEMKKLGEIITRLKQQEDQ